MGTTAEILMGTNGRPGTDDFSQRIRAALGKVGGQPPSGGDVAGPNEMPDAAPGDQNSSISPVSDPSSDRPEEVPSGPRPVGSGEHLVKQGQCIASIAADSGHFWETLWDDSGNAELRAARKEPNVLLPGDRVHVPPVREKFEPGQSEMRHRFRRKGQPDVFRMRVMRDGEARGNEPYVLDVDGTRHEGTTDADGNLSCSIAGNARLAKLSVGAAEDVDEYTFHLGTIDPLDELSGVQGRLNNLGFDCGPVDGVWGPRTEQALKKYQTRRRLETTGRPDEATKQKLREDYGC